MRSLKRNQQYIIFLFFLLLSGRVYTQEVTTNKNFAPHSGQEGKDVVWVPTPQILVDKMLEMAKVTPSDFVMDLGSGDGRLVITAAKKGARALGIEYNPDMVELARENARKAGVSDKASFLQADLFKTDFSEATVITLFLLTDLNVRLRPTLLELKPGTRVVSNTFSMEDWEADQTEVLYEDCDGWCKALLWIVPAKVEGRWRLDQSELTIAQEFQKISGTIKSVHNSTQISEGRLNGNEITFLVNGVKYTGKVDGKRMQGTYTSNGNTVNWSAVRL